jgi:dipeptidyl aminopeptidase/acylaminoacyl peptidase
MGARAALRAHAREVAFVFKVLPMLSSGLVDRVTAAPVVEKIRYASRAGEVTADVYRPGTGRRHPAMVLCLGVVPFGVDHPQIPRLCQALARSGFVALIHWSDAMRDRRLVPEDIADIAAAYAALLERDDVDSSRSGLYGTCVGGSFALLAAAHPLIRDRLGFVGAFAPFSSMWTFARDIASRTREDGSRVVPWVVDQLTDDVFARTVNAFLGTEQARALTEAHDRAAADAALHALPAEARERLDAMSPILHLSDIHASCIAFGHDRDDVVIPVGESRRLAAALAGRRGVSFTEYAMFQHADPTKRHLSPLAFAREIARFYGSLYPLFRRTS